MLEDEAQLLHAHVFNSNTVIFLAASKGYASVYIPGS